MLSMKARLFTFMIKNRHFLQLGSKKKVADWNTYEAVLDFRQRAERTSGLLGKLPEDIKVSSVSIGEMPAVWVLPSHGSQEKAMLYFHGGGYISGTCHSHQAIVAKFVQRSNIGALLFEYRLAPEHRFPAALEDALSAYQWQLSQGIKPHNITFVGDSAGGGLCLATLLAIRDQGLPLPAAAVAYSPVTDFKCTGESYRTNVKKCLSPEGSALAFGKHYAGDNDVDLPYISPLYGNLHGLPPLLIYVGGNETLRDDSIMFAEKAKKAGVDVTLRVGEGLFHCYPACSPLFPEARQAMDEICNFIKSRINLNRYT